MGKHIYWLDECTPECADLVGGKALGLGHLLNGGLQVPPGFVVTTEAYREFVARTGLAGEIDRIIASAPQTPQGQRQASEEIGDLFERAEPDATLVREVESSYARLCDGGEPAPVAVRSSATAEDTADASFAGQQETYLWIQGSEAVADHVTRCWASLFTPQAISYRARLGISSKDVAMGVVVQAMIPAEAAGAMITLDPVTGDPSQISVEASYGLGLAVVAGEVNPDSYSVDKVSLDIRSRTVVDKHVAYRFDPDSGEVRCGEVDPEEQGLACVSDEEVVEIAKVGKQLERMLGGTQDVEWAVGPGLLGPRELFLLQTRPETVWSQKKREPSSSGGTSAMDQMASMFKPPRKADQ